MEKTRYVISFQLDNAEDDAILAELRARVPRTELRRDFEIYKLAGPVSFTDRSTGETRHGAVAREAVRMVMDPTLEPVAAKQEEAALAAEFLTFVDVLNSRPEGSPVLMIVSLKEKDAAIHDLMSALPPQMARHFEVRCLHTLVRTWTPGYTLQVPCPELNSAWKMPDVFARLAAV